LESGVNTTPEPRFSTITLADDGYPIDKLGAIVKRFITISMKNVKGFDYSKDEGNERETRVVGTTHDDDTVTTRGTPPRSAS
jgi:hypothetical protein